MAEDENSLDIDQLRPHHQVSISCTLKSVVSPVGSSSLKQLGGENWHVITEAAGESIRALLSFLNSALVFAIERHNWCVWYEPIS